MFRDKTDRGLRSYSRPILRFSIVAVVLMSHLVLAEEDGTIIVYQSTEAILRPNDGRPPIQYNKTEQMVSLKNEEKRYDWRRWNTDTESNERVTTQNKVTSSFKGRCLLLVESGALRFKQAQMSDSGNYSLQVFDHNGTFLYETQFQLLVMDPVSSLVITVAAVVTGFISLLIASIIFLNLRKKRQQGMMTEGPREENVYVVMCGDRGERRPEKSLEEEGGEESPYVICASIKPTTTRTSVSVEDSNV